MVLAFRSGRHDPATITDAKSRARLVPPTTLLPGATDDLIVYKERAFLTHILKALPKFMLNTPEIRRRAKAIGALLERVRSVHTPAQRVESPRDLADNILSLHASDPQFVPESNQLSPLPLPSLPACTWAMRSASPCTRRRRNLSSTPGSRVRPMCCSKTATRMAVISPCRQSTSRTAF